MNFNPDWVLQAERLEAYGRLCQFFERMLIASQLMEECVEEFGDLLDAYTPHPKPGIFR